MTVVSGGFSQEMLGVCAAEYVVKLNGPNYAFLTSQSGTMGQAQGQVGQKRLNDDGLPRNDTQFVSAALLSMGLDDKATIGAWANSALQSLWPYPVCGDRNGTHGNCTSFPLMPNSEVADKVLGKARSSYFCMWGVAHTLLENGKISSHPRKSRQASN